MKVYKYCKAEHNPLNSCRTLMLGNNKYFRDNYKGEGDLINDIQEGMSTGIDKSNNRFTNVKMHPDGFIFCTSTQKVTKEYASANFDCGYDSCYCIKNVEVFIKRLQKLVVK